MMKGKIVVLFSVILALLLVFSLAAGAEEEGYSIVSPYDEVVWKGENAWSAYKGNLHTHSTVSDADEDYRDMILAYYRQGFDFLAMTDHAVNGTAWNEDPTEVPLFLYQRIIGNIPHALTDEEFEAVTSGSYPVNGTARGYGMTCITGGCELNTLTISKSHVNGLFLPAHMGDGHLGAENDYEGAIRLVDEAGGLSVINHPGDWLGLTREACTDPDQVAYFSDLLLRYDSCMGIEVFNRINKATPNDRWLWDRLLMACLPYGKQVMGYANSDAHNPDNIDTSFMVFMMDECSMESVKETVQNGAFFSVTRRVYADDVLGPAVDLDARGSAISYPTFSDIKVEGHKITVEYSDAYNVQWVGNAEVLVSQDVTECSSPQSFTLDLDRIENADGLLYVRCQLIGEGGVTLTQAFVIEDGKDDPVYRKEFSLDAAIDTLVRGIKSLRVSVLIKLLKREIWG